MKVIELLQKLKQVKEVKLVGSRVTCNPPPTNTDQDYLVLVPFKSACESVKNILLFYGFEDCRTIKNINKNNAYGEGDIFTAFRKGEDNIILTYSRPFFRKFMRATHLAKALNLMHKQQRILLFDYIINGTIPSTIKESEKTIKKL